MKVFISWSGKRSKALANSLRDWLPLVLQYVEPWVSDKDISAGDRWAQAIAGELETSNFGIICITPENLTSEWILFESGALSKSMLDAKVIPLLYGLELSDLSGPLSQFQAQKVEESGLMEVVRAINKVADNKASDEIVGQLVPTLWPRLEAVLNEIPDTEPSGKHMRPQHEILEELVAGVRGLNSRMREYDPESLVGGEKFARRRLRIHPREFMDQIYNLSDTEDSLASLLMLGGYLRNDFPWLAELFLESYREIRDGGTVEVERASRRLRRAIEHTMHGPMQKTLRGSKEVFMIVEELPMLLEMAIRPMIGRSVHGDSSDKSDSEG